MENSGQKIIKIAIIIYKQDLNNFYFCYYCWSRSSARLEHHALKQKLLRKKFSAGFQELQ